MVPLNLPSCNLNVKIIDGKQVIFDIIRKKFIMLTPEEWVRQHFIHLLINSYQYPKGLIKVETGLKYNQLQKRSDIVVYDRSGSTYLIVECKSAEIPISQKVFAQTTSYSYSLKAKYIIVTNGLNHFCCSINHQEKKYEFLSGIPVFGE
jgi:hypothetical protein